jgi:hypothetical protein
LVEQLPEIGVLTHKFLGCQEDHQRTVLRISNPRLEVRPLKPSKCLGFDPLIKNEIKINQKTLFLAIGSNDHGE